MSSNHSSTGIRLSATAVAALLALTACAGNSGSASPGGGEHKTFEVGYITELAGPLAYAGTYFKQGAEVALDKVNAGYLPNGAKLKLLYQEGAGDTPQTIAVFNKFASDTNIIAVTCCIGSAQAGALEPVAIAKKTPLVFYGATLAGITKAPYVYRTVELTEPQYEQMAHKLIDVYHPKTISYVETSDSPTFVASLDAQKKIFDAKGVESLGVDKVFVADTSFDSTVTDILNKKPDVVDLQMVGSQEAALVKGLRSGGYKGPIAVGSSMATASVWKQYGDVLAGTPFPIAYVAGSSTESAGAKAFEDAFQAKFHQPASLYSVEGYMSVMLIADGIKKMGADKSGKDGRARLASALASMGTQTGTPLGTVHYVDGQIQPVTQEYAAFDQSGKVVEWKP